MGDKAQVQDLAGRGRRWWANWALRPGCPQPPPHLLPGAWMDMGAPVWLPSSPSSLSCLGSSSGPCQHCPGVLKCNSYFLALGLRLFSSTLMLLPKLIFETYPSDLLSSCLKKQLICSLFLRQCSPKCSSLQGPGFGQTPDLRESGLLARPACGSGSQVGALCWSSSPGGTASYPSCVPRCATRQDRIPCHSVSC